MPRLVCGYGCAQSKKRIRERVERNIEQTGIASKWHSDLSLSLSLSHSLGSSCAYASSLLRAEDLAVAGAEARASHRLYTRARRNAAYIGREREVQG